MATRFHLFPKLPQELRDAIWRECLPRRVIEIDWPTEMEVLDVDLFDVDDDGRPIDRDISCHMRNTSMSNAKPPIISRVCRESRRVAFETGTLLERQRDPEEPRLYSRMWKHWVDRARDTVVHLHFNFLFNGWVTVWKDEDNGNPVRLLRGAMLPTKAVRSIPTSVLFVPERKEGRDMVESMSEIMICYKVVVLHTDKEPAIQSGLFGMLGEERIVMVDPFDDKRVRQFRDFWRRHKRGPDELTESFFEECVASDPIYGRRAVLKALEETKKRWLIKRWFDTTGPWVKEQDAHGYSRWVPQFPVPGLVEEEVWEKTPVSNDRHYRTSLWVPNQQHPWVRDTYSSMPRFIPTVMFRLCTSVYRKHKKD